MCKICRAFSHFESWMLVPLVRTNDQDQLHFFRPRQLAQRNLCGGPLYCLPWESVFRDSKRTILSSYFMNSVSVFPQVGTTVGREMHGHFCSESVQYHFFFNLLGFFILPTAHDTTLLLADCKTPWSMARKRLAAVHRPTAGPDMGRKTPGVLET